MGLICNVKVYVELKRIYDWVEQNGKKQKISI